MANGASFGGGSGRGPVLRAPTILEVRLAGVGSLSCGNSVLESEGGRVFSNTLGGLVTVFLVK